MDLHYNAFISYRHHPLDIKVAEQIHRGLEHYRIPKALKKDGVKMHLFRDKEELPITSNLTDDITRALEKSDFLIVICSTHTKESIWVQREIEAFLQTHSRNRVLTVIADGEPYEVIPGILCSEERVDPMTGQTVQVPVEPLSCDWRISRRKARVEELPRLAAALLGCGYDELRQRERQYRTRRRTAIFSAALVSVLAFSAYVIRNNIRIQEANTQLELANTQLTDANISIQNNLKQAQINQSRFLASASQQQLESGDRMQAMALALEALPDADDSRPYVARAEKALSDAVGAYVATEQIAAVGVISCDAFIDQFAATDDRKWMFVADQRNILSVWDLKTFQQTAAIPLNANPYALMVTPENTVLVYTGIALACYDIRLNQLWSAADISEACLSEDRCSVLVKDSDNGVMLLDAASGKPITQRVFVSAPDDDSWLWFQRFQQESFDSEKPVLVNRYQNGGPNLILAADLQTGTVTELCSIPQDWTVRGTTYADNGNILVLTASQTNTGVGVADSMTTNGALDSRLYCYTPAGTLLWVTDITAYTYTPLWTIYSIPDTNYTLCQVDNVLLTLDLATGEVVCRCETNSIPLSVEPEPTSATIILQDGSMGLYHYDEATFNSFRYFKDDLSDAFSGNGAFVKQRRSTEILVYFTTFDKNWKPLAGEYENAVDQVVAYGNYLAVYNYDSVCIFDVAAQKLLWQIPEPTLARYQLLGFTHEGKYLWICSGGQHMIRVDVTTNQQDTFSFPDHCGKDTYLSYYSYNPVSMDDGIIYLCAREMFSDQVYILTMDTQTQEIGITQVKDLQWTSYATGYRLQAAHNGVVYLWSNGNATLYQVDTLTQEVSVFAEGQQTQPIIQYLNDGSTIMLSDTDTVTFYRTDGSVLLTGKLENQRGLSAYRTSAGEILLLTDAGALLRCSQSGIREEIADLHLYNTFSIKIASGFDGRLIQWAETGDGDLFLRIDSAGNLVDMDCWELRAWVPQCLAYLPAADQFVTLGKDTQTRENKFGTFPRYSTQQICQMAHDALKGYTLTPEKQEYYGIH